jgi:hypothetical protein
MSERCGPFSVSQPSFLLQFVQDIFAEVYPDFVV